MKRICGLCLLLICVNGFGQTPIPSFSLSIGYQVTTNIIFPYRIEKADLGSADVIGCKGDKLDNVLLLKAAKKNFTPTNLSVYTADGKFYSFRVRYASDPDTLNLSFSDGPVITQNQARLDSDASIIAAQAGFLSRRSKEQKMKVNLTGVYLKDGLLWFQLKISNQSMIAYQPELFKFLIRDRRRGKRTAVQENEEIPVSRTNKKTIPGQTSEVFVLGFNPFTLSRKQKMEIQISERKGGRMLELPVKSRLLLKARSTQP